MVVEGAANTGVGCGGSKVKCGPNIHQPRKLTGPGPFFCQQVKYYFCFDK